jgi:hypothetical protein
VTPMQLRNTIIALLVAAQWRPLIIVAAAVVAIFFGMRWLCRNHPYVAVFLISFFRGLLGSRW